MTGSRVPVGANPDPGTGRRGPVPRLAWHQWALALLGLGLLWPAVVNGGPFFFPDSSTYIRGIDAAAFKATGHRTAWTNDRVTALAFATPAPSPSAVAIAHPPIEAAPVLLGRSPFYGILAYLGAWTGSFWLTIAVQALLAGGTIVGAVRHFVAPSDRRSFAIAVGAMFALLAITPLPFFVSMLMPDFLTGLAVLGAVVLATGWQRERWTGRIGWFGLLGYAALCHATHVLILAALGVAVALVATWRRDPGITRGALAILLAAGIGMAGDLLVAHLIGAIADRQPIRPPFLTARLQEDGPATAFLRDHCPTDRWLLCRYRERLPLGSDAFLWSPDAKTGVFSAIRPAEQRRLADEQGAFVRAVVLNRPISVLRSSLIAAGRQFSAMRLSEFNLRGMTMRNISDQLPVDERTSFFRSAAAGDRMPARLVEYVMQLFLPLSVLAIVLAAGRRRLRTSAAFGWAVLWGWSMNNVICGALSTPHDRYQSRMAWVVIATAFLLLASIIVQRTQMPQPDRITR